eukprot:m51a1_g6305 hypothetical protein (211) ;mRNA; f:316294-317310
MALVAYADDDDPEDEVQSSPGATGVTAGGPSSPERPASPAPPGAPRAAPEAPGAPEASAELVAKLAKFHAMRRHGTTVNESLRRSRNFANPGVLRKLVEALGVDELGTRYPRLVFDPHRYQPADFYDAIAARQTAAERAALHKPKTAVEFGSKWDVGAGVPPAAPAAAAAAVEAPPPPLGATQPSSYKLYVQQKQKEAQEERRAAKRPRP